MSFKFKIIFYACLFFIINLNSSDLTNKKDTSELVALANKNFKSLISNLDKKKFANRREIVKEILNNPIEVLEKTYANINKAEEKEKATFLNNSINKILIQMNAMEKKFFFEALNDVNQKLNSRKLRTLILSEKLGQEILKKDSDLKFIEELIKEGADVNYFEIPQINIYKNLLNLAIEKPSLPILKILLQNNADPEQITARGTALQQLISEGSIRGQFGSTIFEYIEELIKHGANLKVINFMSYERNLLILSLGLDLTPVFKKKGFIMLLDEIPIEILNVIEFLLLAGVDPNQKDILGKSFMDYIEGNKQILQVIEKVKELKKKRKEEIGKATGLHTDLTNIIESYL